MTTRQDFICFLKEKGVSLNLTGDQSKFLDLLLENIDDFQIGSFDAELVEHVKKFKIRGKPECSS